MKLTDELIDAYLDDALDASQAAALKLWLKGHPADAAKVERVKKLQARLLQAKPAGPTAQQSQRMWAAIQAQTGATRARGPMIGFSEPWYAFITRPWAVGGGLTVGLAALLMILRPWNAVPALQEAPAIQVEEDKMAAVAPAANEAAPSRKKSAAPKEESFAEAMPAAPLMKESKKIEAEVAASAAPAPAHAAPTEVEKALADSGLDGMIDNYLAEQKRQAASGMSLRASRSQPSLGAGGASLAAMDTFNQAPSAGRAEAASGVGGGRDQDGFWNWNAAALAMNRRDWPQAKLELLAARSQAGEATERAFASSALTLLSAPGAPLADQIETLPRVGELRVLGAGRWQLLVGNRLARFSEGVSARLPGFRAEGDSLVLDMTFDRGTFSPGTRFVRLSGEAAAQVFDSQGRVLAADDFNAAGGATYHVSGKELRLR